MKKYLSLVAMVMFCSHASSGGEIYKWTDEKGNVYYGDIPKDQASEKVVVPKTNIAEPVKIAEPRDDKNEGDQSTAVTRAPELTERQKRLEEERVAEEKCQRYYGVSCSAVSHLLQRRRPAGTEITPQVPEHRARVSGSDKKSGY